MNTPSILQRNEFIAWSKAIHASITPYGKFLRNYEKNILWDLYKTAQEESPDNWGETTDWRYYFAIKKAIEDWEYGKDYTEIMRLIIPDLEHDKNMMYTNLPTTEESTKIFMEMWAKQFPEVKEMQKLSLQVFIRDNFSRVSQNPDKIMIKSLNPNNVNGESILKNFKRVGWSYSMECNNRILDHRTEWDIKILYAMKLLEEKITRSMEEKRGKAKIDDLKNKL